MGPEQPNSDETPPGFSSSGPVEHFSHSSGRLTATLLVVAGLGLATGAALDLGVSVSVACAAVFLAVLGWAVSLRPRISVVGETLVLRNALETVRMPLAAVEEMRVRHVLVVLAGDRRYVSSALGRSRRSMVRADSLRDSDRASTDASLVVEDRLRQHLDDARRRAGVRVGSAEQLALAAQVRRQPAWGVIAALVVTLGCFVVSLLL